MSRVTYILVILFALLLAFPVQAHQETGYINERTLIKHVGDIYTVSVPIGNGYELTLTHSGNLKVISDKKTCKQHIVTYKLTKIGKAKIVQTYTTKKSITSDKFQMVQSFRVV